MFLFGNLILKKKKFELHVELDIMLSSMSSMHILPLNF